MGTSAGRVISGIRTKISARAAMSLRPKMAILDVSNRGSRFAMVGIVIKFLGFILATAAVLSFPPPFAVLRLLKISGVSTH